MPNARPKAREDLTVVELDGEAVIFDENQGSLHHLNPTASIVFSLCDGTCSVPELARDIAEAFGAPLEDVEPHALSVVADFEAAGLLEGSSVGSQPRG